MSDLIDRQKAIDAIMKLQPYKTKRELVNRIEASIADAEGYLGGIAMALDEIEDLPSEHPEDFEWCKGCKEYDHERGCCPRFNKVIKETVEEVKQNLQVVYCKDCENFTPGKDEWGSCSENPMKAWRTTDFCAWGERKTDATD